MNYISSIFIGIAFFLATEIGSSQNFHTNSGKAIKAYNEGVTAFDYLFFNNAEANLLEAISIDNRFYEAFMMLGELQFKLKRYSEASINFRKAVKIDSLFFKPVFYNLANAEMMSGDQQIYRP